MPSHAHRSDIEGLRAIAILAVVACHAKLPFMQGGFVGVDIFFVLSGYLITGLLVKEINETGKLSFLSFYARRFKRLLPALGLMLVISSLVATVVFSPGEQSSHAYSGQSAFLWMSNFYFAMSDVGYFDAGSSANIFLHTWSLGVEEQFYLVWPALILAMLTNGKQTPALNWLIALFVGGLALSVYLSYASPLFGFYSMPSRAWQFALGGIVWLLPHRSYANGLGYIGMALITVSILAIDEGMTYPGVVAIIPSLGAALVLFARLPALSIKPLTSIGRVSYSWYLWHWPVLIMGGIVFNRHDIAFQLLLAAVSFALAVLAYALVENPIRRSPIKPASVVAASALVMASGAVLASGWIDKARLWGSSPEMEVYAAIRANAPQVYGMECDAWFESAELTPCQFGSGEKVAVLFGDSFAVQWFSAFAKIYVDSGWSLIVLTKSACPMVDQSIYYDRIKGMYQVCDEWRRAAAGMIAGIRPDIVLMGSSLAYEFTPAEWRDGAARIITPLSEVAGKIYVIRPTPSLSFDGPNCLARHQWQPAFLAGLSHCDSPASTEPDESVLNALQEASKTFDNVSVLDFSDLVCPDGICSAGSYRDNAHITDRFVRSITPQIREIINHAQ